MTAMQNMPVWLSHEELVSLLVFLQSEVAGHDSFEGLTGVPDARHGREA